jgi:hypothetical protein
MPKYMLEAPGLITLRAEVEAASPEEALIKGKALTEKEWQVDTDSRPTCGEISFITEFGLNDDDVEEFEVTDGVVSKLWAGEIAGFNTAEVQTGHISCASPNQGKAPLRFDGKHLTIKDLLQLPHDEVLEPDHSANKEGLTFKEWLTAADIWHGDNELGLEPLPIGSAYNAWYAGEDPTEWRAEHSNGEIIK